MKQLRWVEDQCHIELVLFELSAPAPGVLEPSLPLFWKTDQSLNVGMFQKEVLQLLKQQQRDFCFRKTGVDCLNGR